MCLINQVIILLISALFVAGFNSCLLGETVTLGSPENFQPYGNFGYSAVSDSIRTFMNEPTMRISILNGGNASWAGLSYTSTKPIQAVTYYQFDESGPATPFYNYLYLGDTTFAWQDAGLGGRIASYGGENYSNIYRSIGWHKVEANIDDLSGSNGVGFIRYKIDDIEVARISITNPILTLAFDISSAGRGSFSYNISQVTLVNIPEPSALSLLAVGLGGWALVRRRS